MLADAGLLRVAGAAVGQAAALGDVPVDDHRSVIFTAARMTSAAFLCIHHVAGIGRRC